MKLLLSLLFSLSVLSASAQVPSDTLLYETYCPKAGEIEFFAGVDLSYRDILLTSPYEFLIQLTPGVKYRPWAHTLISAQAVIPIINDYGHHYKNPRLNVLTISQELLLFKHLALKPTLGLFTQERYGLDVKAMYPVNRWLAFEGQIGLTGYLSMAEGWQMSDPTRVLALAGADVYLSRWNTQFRLIGGRFLSEDTGVVFEVMRHFRHCTVGAFGQYSERASSRHGLNGGFKITMAIPPYKRRHKTVTWRPANNFTFSYNMNADPYSNKNYKTDPEENDRHGWFSPDILPWGANRIYDYRVKPASKTKKAEKAEQGDAANGKEVKP